MREEYRIKALEGRKESYLTEDEIRQARALRRQGLSYLKIAARMRRHRTEITRITRDVDPSLGGTGRPHNRARRLNRLEKLHLLLQRDREIRTPPPVTLPFISFLDEQAA